MVSVVTPSHGMTGHLSLSTQNNIVFGPVSDNCSLPCRRQWWFRGQPSIPHMQVFFAIFPRWKHSFLSFKGTASSHPLLWLKLLTKPYSMVKAVTERTERLCVSYSILSYSNVKSFASRQDAGTLVSWWSNMPDSLQFNPVCHFQLLLLRIDIWPNLSANLRNMWLIFFFCVCLTSCC